MMWVSSNQSAANGSSPPGVVGRVDVDGAGAPIVIQASQVRPAAARHAINREQGSGVSSQQGDAEQRHAEHSTPLRSSP
jgi:hypothetical protein